MNEMEPRERRIVVGFDGSPSAKHALAWAIGQAAATEAVVDAVIAWELPVTYGWAGYATERELSGWADKELVTGVNEVVKTHGEAPVRQHVRCGNAADVLIDMAKGAELLVVGSHGRAGFRHALLGSVGAHCAHHAPCPVVIVRGPDRHGPKSAF